MCGRTCVLGAQTQQRCVYEVRHRPGRRIPDRRVPGRRIFFWRQASITPPVAGDGVSLLFIYLSRSLALSSCSPLTRRSQLFRPLRGMLLQVPGACSVSVSVNRWLANVLQERHRVEALHERLPKFVSFQLANNCVYFNPIPIFPSIRVIPNCNCNRNCTIPLCFSAFLLFCFPPPLCAHTAVTQSA